jgi:hypothetical protein
MAAVAVAPPMASAEEVVAAATAEAEATRTTTPQATNVAATTHATGSTRYATPRRVLTSVTVTVYPPTLHDFALCFVDGPYNKDSTVKTSVSRGVYNKFHTHFYY